jgi:hypothetical protein
MDAVSVWRRRSTRSGVPADALAAEGVGESGVSGYERVSSATLVGGNSIFVRDVSCPAGKRVLGGGVTNNVVLDIDVQSLTPLGVSSSSTGLITR